MIGIDTSFLVAFEIAEHEKHSRVRSFAHERVDEGFALAAQVLTEFCHVVTDPRRFARPLSMEQAVGTMSRWWQAVEVTVVSAGEEAGNLYLELLLNHQFGRKRLLDTMLAATYLAAGVHTVLTLDGHDFARFPRFAPIVI